MKNLLVVLLALTSTAAFAASNDGIKNRANTGMGGTAAYGMAGCGLGSLVFKENTKAQILAATTNGTFGSQTFGITFGTSNCAENGHMASKEQVQSFIAANQQSLQNDVARGNGETLSGLAELMGRKNSPEFNATMKANYKNIFASNNLSAQQITDNMFHVMN